MLNKSNFLIILLFFFLLLRPPCAAAQTGESFKANTGNFTPSTVIIIVIGIIFILTGFLAVFLRQFSDGCFGLSVVPANPNVTADGLPVARGLDAEAIKSIPTYFYSDVKQHRQGKVELECAVCLSEFQDPEALRLLPGCSHVFHPRCIDPWLASHVTCPVCRQSLEEPGSGAEKPCAIDIMINITRTQNESNGPDLAREGDHHEDDDHQSADRDSARNHDEDDDDEKEMKRIVGKFPRSHSTGHSMSHADSERFTLRLPEEVQNTLVNRSSYGPDTLTSMLSASCGWFSMTPPIINHGFGSVRSSVPTGLILRGLENPNPLPLVKTSDRFWPI